MKKLFLALFISGQMLLLFAAESAGQKLNTSLGFELFAETNMWSKAAFQKRNRIRLVGNNTRFAARFPRMIAGAKAVEIEVYTDKNNDKISRISIVYANQGDTGKRYKTEITRNARDVAAHLTGLFGQKKKGSFSSGASDISGNLWQCASAKFFLEVDKGEFLMLHILPADTPGKKAELRKTDFSRNVKTNKFGDVFIPNVPMVDQGAKGYCIPATMARIFLYYGIDADMHHMAKIGNTKAKDGTNTGKMLKDVRALRKKADLKMSEFSSLMIRDVARHIDKGHPVMWIMYSTPGLHKVYRFSRANRPKAATPDAWKRQLKKISVSASTEGPHALLIIGYNKQTDEIAVTNSWGPAHIAPLWIPLKVARKVSQNHLVVFAP